MRKSEKDNITASADGCQGLKKKSAKNRGRDCFWLAKGLFLAYNSPFSAGSLCAQGFLQEKETECLTH